MTPDERSTDRIRDWLAGTADELGDPTRGMNAVLTRLSVTPQAGRWRSWPRRAGASFPGQAGGDRLAAHGASGRTLGVAGLAILVAGIGAGLVAGSALVQQREPRTIVVAQDGTGDTESIGGGVAMAVDGDTILVRPGRYVEQVTVGADLEIRGDGHREDIVIEAPDAPGSSQDGSPIGAAVTYRGSTGSLANLTILGGDHGSGISVEAAAAPEISNVIIRAAGGPTDGTVAVQWSDGGSGVLQASTVAGVLRMTGPGTAPAIEWNNLRETCIVFEADGSAPADEPWPVLRENAIAGCTDDVLVRITGGSPLLEGNDLSLAEGTALALMGVSSAQIERNTIHDSGTAISIADPQGPVTVADNVLTGDAVGVAVIGGSEDVRIEGNEIRDGGVAIDLDGGTDPVISGNVLCGNAEAVRVLPAGREAVSVDGQDACSVAGASPSA